MSTRRTRHTMFYPGIAMPLLALLVGGYFFLLPSIAQTATGSITGNVTDPVGAAVPDAAVKAKNQATGESRVTTTNMEGRYILPGLPFGTYEITVQAKGFRSAASKAVVVGPGEAASYNVHLAVGQPAETVEVTGPGRITGREFLGGTESEEPGFGLYSYLLFGSPPSDATRPTYLQVLQAYLKLSKVKDLMKYHLKPEQLNITYLPLTESQPESATAETVLAAYNYDRAIVLLAKLPGGPHTQGPYIVSTSKPLTDQEAVSENFLFQDMSSIPSEVVPLWVDEFLKQSAQKKFWQKRDGPYAALTMRTMVARLAAGVDPAKKSAKEWQGILGTLLFWKGGESPAK